MTNARGVGNITINGFPYKFDADNITANIGENSREEQTANPGAFTERENNRSLTATIYLRNDEDPQAIADLQDATVTVEERGGRTMTFFNASQIGTGDNFNFTDGSLNVTFTAESVTVLPAVLT